MTTTETYVSPELRKLAEVDEFGRYLPLAVYARYPVGGKEIVTRNLTVDQAEQLAATYAGSHYRVHVSLDTCG